MAKQAQGSIELNDDSGGVITGALTKQFSKLNPPPFKKDAIDEEDEVEVIVANTPQQQQQNGSGNVSPKAVTPK